MLPTNKYYDKEVEDGKHSENTLAMESEKAKKQQEKTVEGRVRKHRKMLSKQSAISAGLLATLSFSLIKLKYQRFRCQTAGLHIQLATQNSGYNCGMLEMDMAAYGAEQLRYKLES